MPRILQPVGEAPKSERFEELLVAYWSDSGGLNEAKGTAPAALSATVQGYAADEDILFDHDIMSLT
jgi:hypothetical protein